LKQTKGEGDNSQLPFFLKEPLAKYIYRRRFYLIAKLSPGGTGFPACAGARLSLAATILQEPEEHA
jgi:hypothetical protein